MLEQTVGNGRQSFFPSPRVAGRGCRANEVSEAGEGACARLTSHGKRERGMVEYQGCPQRDHCGFRRRLLKCFFSPLQQSM
jgi:hypothetical protein